MSTSRLNFRLATPEDAPALERLINTAFNADTTTQVFLSTDHAATVVTDIAGILAKIADPTCAVLVAADPIDVLNLNIVEYRCGVTSLKATCYRKTIIKCKIIYNRR